METPDTGKKLKRQVVTEMRVTMNDGYNRSGKSVRRQDDAVRIVAAGIRATSKRSIRSVHVNTYTIDIDD